MAVRRRKGDRGPGGPRKRPASRAPEADRPPARGEPLPAPFSSAGDRLLLQTIGPYGAHAFWSVSPRSVEARRERAGDPSAPLVLRFRAWPPRVSEREEAPASFDVEVSGPEGNYYANLWRAGHVLLAELGVKAASGAFVPVVRSNRIELPPDAESPRYELRFRRVHGAPSPLWRARFAPERERAAGGPCPPPGSTRGETPPPGDEPWAGAPAVLPSVPAGRWEPVLHAASELGGAAAPAPAAAPDSEEAQAGSRLSGARRRGPGELPSSAEVSSFAKPVPLERPYLEVRADVVIYGVAEPGSRLVIDGVAVPVRDDGTFDVRFSLPAGAGPDAPAASPEAGAAGEREAPEGGRP